MCLYILYVYPNNSLSVKEVNLLIGKVPVNLGISNFNNLKVFLLSNNGRIYYLNDLIYNQLQSSSDPLGIYSYDINDPNAVTYTQYTSCEGVLPPCVVTNWYFNTSLIIRDLGTSAITIKSIYLDLKAYSPSLKTAQGFDYNGQLNGSFNPSLPVTLQPSSSITFRINSYLGSTSYSSSAPVYSSGSAYYVATIFIVYQNQDLTQEYQSFTIFYGMAPWECGLFQHLWALVVLKIISTKWNSTIKQCKSFSNEKGLSYYQQFSIGYEVYILWMQI